MHLTIHSYCGLEHVDLNLSEKISLFAGPNGAGKTSVADCLAVCFTGQPQDAKKDAHENVRRGSSSARATLSADTAFRSVTWAGNKTDVQTNGKAPYASALATGKLDPFALPDKERTTLFGNLLQCNPTFDDLSAALKALNFDDESITKVWTSIQSLDWEGAKDAAQKRGVELKGAWQQVTGENFGKDKYTKWLPVDWDPSLESLTTEDLQEVVRKAEKHYESLLVKAALSEADRAKLQEQADQLPALTAAASEAQEQLKQAQITWEVSIEASKKNRAIIVSHEQFSCPSCTEPFVMQGGKAIKIPPGLASKDEVAKSKAEAARFQEAETQASAVYLERKSAFEKAHELSRQAHIAKLDLDDQALKEQISPETVAAAKAEAEALRKKLNTLCKMNEARGLAEGIKQNLALQDLLAPQGLRYMKLLGALGKLNDQLSSLCRQAGWKNVRIAEDLTARYDEINYRKCSNGEKLRVRAALQMLWANRDGSEIIILDHCEVLDKPGLRGLSALCTQAGIPAVICLKADDASEVPNLSIDGRGVTYWVSNSTAKAV